MKNNFEIHDFANSFGVDPSTFSTSLIHEMKALNFKYREPSKQEFENLILEILKKIQSDKQIIGAEEREKVWFDGWNENLEMYRESDFDDESLTPKFVRPGNPIRLNQSYVFPEDDNFELNFIKIYRLWYLEKYFSDVENIYEFGCGTGFNLLAANTLFPEKRLFGSDFVQSSVDLVNEIAGSKKINLRGDLFNMLSPDYNYDVLPNSGIYTFGALEQLASDTDPILEFFISKRPSICIHTEPVIELYDRDNNLSDFLAAQFQGKRGYTSGLTAKLRKLESEGKIEILSIKRLYFGSFFMEGYNHIAWKPL